MQKFVKHNLVIIIGLALSLNACSTIKSAYNSAFGSDDKATEASLGTSTAAHPGKMPETDCQIRYKEAYLACIEKVKGKDQTINDKQLNECIQNKGFANYDANCKSPAK